MQQSHLLRRCSRSVSRSPSTSSAGLPKRRAADTYPRDSHLDGHSGADMNKSNSLNKLDAIATERLFGVGPWLVNNRDAAIALTKTLQPLGLEEPVSNTTDTFTLTNLGKQLNFDLYRIFVGLLEPWDA